MASVTKPATDEELAIAERAQRLRRMAAELEDGAPADVLKLAEAGEPEANDTLRALSSALNRSRHNGDALAATSVAASARQDRIADPVETEAVEREREQIRKTVEKGKRREKRIATNAEAAALLMDTNWKQWAKEADKHYVKACREFAINVGNDAQQFVQFGVFPDHLAVATFIQKFYQVDTKENPDEDNKYVDDFKSMRAKLRGMMDEDDEPED